MKINPPATSSREKQARNKSRFVAVLLICACLILPQTAFGAWGDNPIAFDLEHQEMGYPRIIYDGQGGYFAIWDMYLGNIHKWSLFVQYFDPAGDPRWGAGGVLVREETVHPGHGRAVPDGQGGIIIAWSDDRRTGFRDTYAQRIGANGEPAWATDGVAVIAVDDQFSYCGGIVPDGEGGAIIVSFAPSGRANRVDSDGTLHWGAADNAAIFTTGPVYSVEMVPDNAGGAFIAWSEHDDNDNEDDIAVQHIGENLAGNFEAGWNNGDPLFLTTNGTSRIPRLIPGSDAGAIIIWHTTDTGTGKQLLYAQKVNGNGTPQWDDGKLIEAADSIRADFFDLASDGSGGAFITWVSDEVYAQRVGANGEPLWTVGNTPTAVQLNAAGDFSAVQTSFPHKTVEDGLGGFITAWLGNGNRVMIQGCNATGALLWEAGGVVLAQGTNTRIGPTLAANGQGGAVALWTDYPEPSREDIFIQGINVSGTPGDPGYVPPPDPGDPPPPDPGDPPPADPGDPPASSPGSSGGGCFIGAAYSTTSDGVSGIILLMIAGAGVLLCSLALRFSH